MIKVLPKEVADKIAAGEVIESPVSIVKELVENSIDSGATAITCEIVKGGKEEIRVTDNGAGIPSEEVETAFLRHATSKITKTEDLKNLYTLGFRGEALASIAAVSRTELITKTKEEKAGTRIVIHGGITISKEGIGCPEGTTIIVRDLFYNMPARGKFMKSEAAEAGKVIDMMSRLAITRPDIRFTMISNGKTFFVSQGNGDLKAAILAVYKEREFGDLVEVVSKDSHSPVKVKGFVSRPSFTRTSRRSQYYFVNGRAVKNSALEKGVDLGYKERLFEGRQPIVFLFVDVEPGKLDVNVHPNKKEVKFEDEIQVITAVEEAVQNTIKSEEGVIKGLDTYKKESDNIRPIESKDKSKEKKDEQIDIREFLKAKTEIKEENLVAYNKEPELASKEEPGFDFEEEQASYFGEPDTEVKSKPFFFDDLVFRGAIFGTYLLATDHENFYLFDQHAAHERINYEKFVKAYWEGEKEGQILLTPFTFDVPLDMTEDWESWVEILNAMGYSVESFGENTFIVREIPAFLDMSEGEDFVKSFVDSYHEDIKKENTIVIDKLITKACKASIKANDYIKDEEITALIEDLKKTDNPFSCPHGRPTFIKFSKYDLEKMFKRIV